MNNFNQKLIQFHKKTENVIKLKYDCFDIIRKLMKDSGGNAIEREIIDLTSSSCFSNDYKPSNAVLFDNLDKVFASKEPGSWICFEF